MSHSLGNMQYRRQKQEPTIKDRQLGTKKIELIIRQLHNFTNFLPLKSSVEVQSF
jgi:hypothetical protein